MGELNNNGFVMLSRDILKDPMYLSERFTRMQAYSDLCYLAAFKEREFRIRGNKVTLQRGQVAKSVRDLAQRWQWSVNTVTKFIKELQEDGYIETQRTSVNQIITIKRYLIYNTQNETQNETRIETQTNTQNDTSIINIKELKKEIKKEIEEELANASKKNKSSAFVPPTIDEVQQYIEEKSYRFDAEDFIYYYESVGWYIGKSKMKNWKAACWTWEKNRKTAPRTNSHPFSTALHGNRNELVGESEGW